MFHSSKVEFNFFPYICFLFVFFHLVFRELFSPRPLIKYPIVQSLLPHFLFYFLASVSLVSKNGFFFSMQQVSQFTHVTYFCCSTMKRMNESRFMVCPYMYFHSKMIAPILLGRAHLRISFLLFIFRRTWSFDEACVYTRSLIQNESFFSHHFYHHFK